MTDEFTSEEKELIDRLRDAGMRRCPAFTLVYIAGHEGCKQKEIQFDTGLRQPEISVGVSELIQNGWVRKEEVKKDEGKGRPSHEYYLGKPIGDMISDIEEKEKERISKIRVNMDKINDLVDKYY